MSPAYKLTTRDWFFPARLDSYMAASAAWITEAPLCSPGATSTIPTEAVSCTLPCDSAIGPATSARMRRGDLLGVLEARDVVAEDGELIAP